MKIRYILIIAGLAWAYSILSMELPTKKQKLEAPRQVSIADYLQKQPQLINQRRKGDMLDLSKLNLTSLEGLHFLPDYAAITHLNLADNGLATIKNKAFYGMNNLETLDLFNNKIKTLEPFAFNGLKKIKKIDLNGNNIRRIEIAFAQLAELEELYLELNKIEYIAPYAFRDLKNLKKLWLGHNNLQTIDARALKGPQDQPLRALEILDLEYNPLSEEEQDKIEDMVPPTITLIF
jgi:Leucine-rich repeat (LRR) protein